MKKLTLKDSCYIGAPREKIYAIMSNFEAMPKNFPGVAESLEITQRDGNHLKIIGRARGLGRTMTVNMETELMPPKGYNSGNSSPITKDEYDEFLMEEECSRTRINYLYEIEVRNRILRFFAKPLIGGFSMWR